MEMRVEGRRSIGRLRETWLENVEAYMAEKTSMTGRNETEYYEERGSPTLSENRL